MIYDFTQLKKEIKNIENRLMKEFSNIRTGMVSVALLDNIKAGSYGVLTPINQMASIVVEDARSLRVILWDVSQIKEVEAVIRKADLGVSISVDDSGVRLTFPELTSERRQLLTKSAKSKLEEVRVSLRLARDRVWNEIQSQEKENEISQDDKFQLKDEMQKIVDNANEIFTALFNKKEKEIMR